MSMTKAEKIEHIKEVYKLHNNSFTAAREVGLKLGLSEDEIKKALKIRERRGIGEITR